MKPSSHCSRTSGFSLVELIVVISIIFILIGIGIAAIPGVMERVNRNKVQTFIAELERGLASYQLDHGIYPQNPSSGDRDQSGVEGAKILYKHLSGDWDLDGKWDGGNSDSANATLTEADGEKVYVPKLVFEEQQEGAKSVRSIQAGGSYYVVDAYGDPIRYLADPPNINPSDRKTYNPTYDLWSIAGEDPKNPDAEPRYITNWKSN